MEIRELLSWLRYTDLKEQPAHQVLILLESVLEVYPEEREVCERSEDLLIEVEELLEEDQPDISVLSEWPELYADLL